MVLYRLLYHHHQQQHQQHHKQQRHHHQQWSRLLITVSFLPAILYLVGIPLVAEAVHPGVNNGSTTSISVLEGRSIRSTTGSTSRGDVGRVRNKRDGSWSEWSNWSPCSRTCGGGIRTQTRQCQLRKTKSSSSSSSSALSKSSSERDIFGVSRDRREQPQQQDAILLSRYESRNVSSRNCEGHATRHHLCNTQDCPVDTIDFRESQCKAFDNRPFMGKVYQWESFIDERSPCSLTCRAKGYRFFATLNKSVVDGTSCTKPTQLDLHVCIAGSCTPIGCDGIAGSTRRLDICGVCGGDNSTCRVVSGIFTRPQLSIGYNVVASIPKGACKLNISEIRSSANTLALRRQDGTFIFNGDYRRPSWPGVYDGAGTKFQYTRGVSGDGSDLSGKMTPETISSAGPLREPVDLMVLYQQPNPGIKYEYILPLGDSPIPPAPAVQQDSAGGRLAMAATSRPGSFVSGPQQLVKSLKDSPPLTSQPHHHHHHHNHLGRRRASHQALESKRDSSAAAAERAAVAAGDTSLGGPPPGKKFYWKIITYTNCSEVCGGGTQRSIIRCVRAPQENPVSDRRCVPDSEKPPSQTIRCNLKPCPAEWIVGEWSNCSVENCGSGYKTRSVHCEQRISATLKMKVMEAACLQRKPEPRTGCQLRSCYHWTAGEWSECSAKCGNGVRRRVVLCVNSKTGEKVAGEECEREGAINGETKRPAEIKACNMGPCDMGTDWFASEWGKECSQRCGGGIQTRHVVCSGIKKKKWWSGSKEESASKELETNIIDQDDDEDSSKSGHKSGEVNSEAGVYCDEERKPEEERECFSDRMCGEATWFTGPWGECSVYCGSKGLRTRQVLCVIFSRGKFKVVTDSLCSEGLRPGDRESCDSHKECGSRWFTTEWSECSAVCGGGVQKRSVSCRASNWTSTSTLCTDKDRPVERRSCNEYKCSVTITTAATTSTTIKIPPLKKLSGGEENGGPNSDKRGILKDKPLISERQQQQASGGGTLLEMVAAATTTTTSSTSSVRRSLISSSGNSSTNSSSNSSRANNPNLITTASNYSINSSDSNYGSSNKTSSRGGRSSPSLSTENHSSSQQQQYQHASELHEETDEPECLDQYRNCALVVQARLCRYKYYRSVCCNSCADSH